MKRLASGKYFITSIIILAILAYLYIPITLGLDGEDMSILGLPLLIGLTAFQYVMGRTIWHWSFIGHGLVGLGWSLTFPLLFHWSYTKPFYFYEFANDYLFGLTLFIGLSLIHYGLVYVNRHTKIIAALFSIIQGALLFIPLAQIGYYISTWHCVTPATLMAMYQTNPEEAFGFLKNTAGPLGLVAILIGYLILFYALYRANRKMRSTVESNRYRHLARALGHKGSQATFVIVTIIVSLYSASLFPKTDIIENWMQVADYMKELQNYHNVHGAIADDVHLTTDETAAKKVPGTIILVIGESSSRDYMKVYTPSFPYDDTPWQDTLRQNPGFTVFDHAYSSYVQTVPTLERALTERNQYDDKPFFESATILDVAKKAGYYTNWFSNQGVYGEYDTAISLIAKAADNPKWAHESYAFSDQYDGALLPLLKTVDPGKNNFIVIHIMGSHIYYQDRYPHEFSKWKKGVNPEGIEAYANSQLYTDWLLQEIFKYGKEHLNLQAMVYFSDHGENIHTSHNPDIFEFDMTRIPFWIYLSPTYRAAYPETAKVLAEHQGQYFTNDLLYDMLVGLMHAPNNRYDPTRDFGNPAYRFNQGNLTTMLGTQPLSKDTGN